VKLFKIKILIPILLLFLLAGGLLKSFFVSSSAISQPDLPLYHPQYYLLQRALLDTSLKENRNRILINMERWKAIPKNTGRKYLMVNIADFRMNAIENDSLILSLKTIVGKLYRKTPLFHTKMTHIVFNPTWTIPPNILRNDILPLIKKDISYLKKRNIRIFQTDKTGKRKQVSADSINWKAVSEKQFPYQLVQDAGKDNALGVVKFMFPNSYHVYMHDTPSKELFEETERTFSSGCIRVSNAIDLATYLLKNKWDKTKIMNVIKSGKTFTVYLVEPVEVYIEYFTAWVDADGILQFRKDIYERDSFPVKIIYQ